MVRLIRVADADEAGRVVADEVGRLVAGSRAAVLGVATGASPRTAYAEICRRVAAGDMDVSRLSLAMLDEYVGLPQGHPESFHVYVRSLVADPCGIPDDRIVGPRAEGGPDAVAEFASALRALGTVDLQICGVGRNGHVGFNEPGSPADGECCEVELAESTRRDAVSAFGSLDRVPRRAITQGIATMRRARHLLVLAFGGAKADAVAGLLSGPASSDRPVSLLRDHPALSLVADDAALRA
jgi:glucosamine-6-phosphate deaminase